MDGDEVEEMVVLVDEGGAPIGEMPKRSVHSTSTPRHLAFSCHLVDRRGRLLVTRRALVKATWPGVWTNALCGHPLPGEAMEDAVRRRAWFELGAEIRAVTCILPDFGYTARDASGIQENEHCPVFIAEVVSPLVPHPDEVDEVEWTTVGELSAATSAAPWAFSPWLVAHLPALAPHLLEATARHHA